MLIGSWHPKHSLPAAFLITLISADSFCCFTSDYFPERAGGNYNNAPARLEQSFENKTPPPLDVLGRDFTSSGGCCTSALCCVMLLGLLYSRKQGGKSYFIAVSQWAIYNVPVKFMVYGIYVIVQKSLDLSSLHHSCMAVCARPLHTLWCWFSSLVFEEQFQGGWTSLCWR